MFGFRRVPKEIQDRRDKAAMRMAREELKRAKTRESIAKTKEYTRVSNKKTREYKTAGVREALKGLKKLKKQMPRSAPGSAFSSGGSFNDNNVFGGGSTKNPKQKK